MERLIDADVMVEYLRKQLCDNCHEQEDWCDICDYAYLIDEMKKVPTVDAEPVKHGHWIMTNKEKTDRPLPECSRCGWYVTKGGVLDFTYCPNCGCKMDEVEDDKRGVE